jgi:hypothetical protein
MTKCKECRAEFVKRSMTHKCCSPECAEIFGREQTKLQVAKKEREETKVRREKLKDRRDYIREAKTAMHAYVRARDAGKLCISCLKWLPVESKLGGGFDAGHFRSVGSAKHLEFDERNIHGQCKHCNNYLAGNALEYRKGLIEREGIEFVEGIENDNEPRKLTIDDLKQIKLKYREKLKNLDRANG